MILRVKWWRNVKNKDFFANLKAQSWWSLRMRFQNTYRALKGMEYEPDNLISLSSEIDKKEFDQLIMELSQPNLHEKRCRKNLSQ